MSSRISKEINKPIHIFESTETSLHVMFDPVCLPEHRGIRSIPAIGVNKLFSTLLYLDLHNITYCIMSQYLCHVKLIDKLFWSSKTENDSNKTYQ